MKDLEKYEVVVIGSGLGGLLCANFLAMEGMRVCVVEKNKQFGGNLQTFSRNKQIFDTGVHYIGGLEKGQNLYQIFSYAGLMEKLRLKRMDDGFDKIFEGDDEAERVQYQGWETFIHQLAKQFPDEEKAIQKYYDLVRETCSRFPLYTLTLQQGEKDKEEVLSLSAKKQIESITQNKKLQKLLAGNNLLYAGEESSPFYVHALITNSYIESSWKCVDGGSQIAKILVSNIRSKGGNIKRNTTVSKIVEEDGRISFIETEQGNKIYGNYFISNISPADTLSLTNSSLLKNSYRKRIETLENSVGSFSLHIVLKENSVPYPNHNIYYHKENMLWQLNDYTQDDWPRGYGLYFSPNRKNESFAATISILTPMRFSDVAKWQHTYNREGKASNRGKDYDDFKNNKAEILLNLVEKRLPCLRKHIQSYYTSTPLSNRDYIGGTDGSMYGIKKDIHNTLMTTLSPRTKVPNLFLTGQNINLHGILGTSLTSVLTCCLLLNDFTLVDKIRNA